MEFQATAEFATSLDKQDPLREFRDEFLIPQHNSEPCVYLCGNSLGLQPKATADSVMLELEDWHKYGVEGHMHSRRPWFSYHKQLTDSLARIVGALPHEVVSMNALTVNLHLMMVTFYRPTEQRFKIICEAGAFPSDQYALETQVRHHGLNPDDAIVELSPRDGEHTLRTEDIVATIEQHADQLALVMISGVQYYTGQFFEIPEITKAGHRAGAVVGWDLAHAVGNVELHLHEWDVDFAVWCSYKYLNSSPGGVSGVFVHERHAQNTSLPRFGGWWGNAESERFEMKKGFRPEATAEAWQLSNAPVLLMAAHRASLDIFDKVSMHELVAKQKQLTGYLEYLIEDLNTRNGTKVIDIITPRDMAQRGCQLSLVLHGHGKTCFDYLTEHGVVADWREPAVIRIAPVPLYNTYHDVFRFYSILKTYLDL